MTADDEILLKRLAGKYIWWKTPEESIEQPLRILAQVMNIGDFEDTQIMRKHFGDNILREVIAKAEIGQFNDRSWHYWHLMLDISEMDSVPLLPARRFL